MVNIDESLFDDDDERLFRDGRCTTSRCEIFASSKYLNANIELVELDEDCREIERNSYKYQETNFIINMVNQSGIFGIELSQLEQEERNGNHTKKLQSTEQEENTTQENMEE